MQVTINISGSELLGYIAVVITLYAILLPKELKEKLISTFQETELIIGKALEEISEKNISFSFHEQIYHVLDNAFGKELLGFKAATRSLLHTYLICLLLMLPVVVYQSISSPDTQNDVGMGWLLIYTCFFPISLISSNFIPDFLATTLSRLAIRYFGNSSFLRWTMIFIVILLLNIFFGLVSVYLMEIKTRWGEFVWSDLLIGWREVIIDSEWQGNRNPEMAQLQKIMSFLTTFSITFWITIFSFLRISSLILNKLFGMAQIPGKYEAIVNNPIRMFFVLILTITVLAGIFGSISIA